MDIKSQTIIWYKIMNLIQIEKNTIHIAFDTHLVAVIQQGMDCYGFQSQSKIYCRHVLRKAR